ncbi:hypothetical protein SAMN04489735_100251 [Aneurinibacillus thermoaerophilus]|uniref:Uncharacterized protein n=1 Tax=Aneurinibacillus thermoaerophilus TaxID=143495 RepID=A0A1G7WPW5_ANETH|nr:hypothetical protein SAMN04489735_100251 [Aneurinibacillus thermoaerophilus]
MFGFFKSKEQKRFENFLKYEEFYKSQEKNRFKVVFTHYRYEDYLEDRKRYRGY